MTQATKAEYFERAAHLEVSCDQQTKRGGTQTQKYVLANRIKVVVYTVE